MPWETRAEDALGDTSGGCRGRQTRRKESESAVEAEEANEVEEFENWAKEKTNETKYETIVLHCNVKCESALCSQNKHLCHHVCE